jgi:cell division cycle 20-like protein 1 (cofactor of APC complex)
MTGHVARVGAMAWTNPVLATGSRDKNILFRDLRLKKNFYSVRKSHKQEICGLKWSHDG